MSPAILQGLKYGAAVVLAPILAAVIGSLFSFAIDFVWGHRVTGGDWALTVANVLLMLFDGFMTGLFAGWIAGRHGKLIGAVANCAILFFAITVGLALNFNVSAYLHAKPMLFHFAWIGLIPAMLGGHLAVKAKPSGLSSLLGPLGGMMLFIAQFGIAIFHFYTAILAYQVDGFYSAFVSISLPIISELYWLVRIWHLSGAFWNVYSLRFAVLIVWTGAAFAMMAWAINREERKQLVH